MEDGFALVQVCNESSQLLDEDLERIFDKFYRVTRADKVVGTGLGLSICRGIVEAHGGRIWATNADSSRGVVFNFTLPLTWDGARPKLPPPEL
jgi:two-component system sensor histidine kinase KdpD